MDKNVFARIGTVIYVLWGLLHYNATYSVYNIALGVPPSMVQGRLFQDAFFLSALATVGIVVAIKMNWQNSRTGFWLNALVLAITDVPFILFVLVPGYAPFWPGVLGPALWVAGMIFTGLGQMRPTRVMHASA
jgi:hypothetical protein